MSSSSAPDRTPLTKEKDLSQYLLLYRAVSSGDWDTAKGFLDRDPNAATAKITTDSETALHVAVGTRKATRFLENLLDLIPLESLETLTDKAGKTVLHYAAIAGNTEAAKILVARNAGLPNTFCNKSQTPMRWAARYGHRELTRYLFSVTKKDSYGKPFEGVPGVLLLNTLILSEFYDMALQLVQDNPELATIEFIDTDTPPLGAKAVKSSALGAIAGKSSAFPSGAHYKPWQWFIYSRVPLKFEDISSEPSVVDSENPNECRLASAKMSSWVRFTHFIHVCQKLIWTIMGRLVPHIKGIRETKQMHSQTLQLVKCLCDEIASLDDSVARSRFASPVFSAAKLGIHEVAQVILDKYPAANWSLDDDERHLFHHAVINRRENVFNLLYKSSEYNRLGAWYVDKNYNTTLHLAGNLAPAHRINLVSGAALQMQRELQWFKEVQKWVQPEYYERKNSEGKTPSVIFTEEHKELVKEGERWMKDTANSCSVAAALIATIAFAAAITVPGGNNGNSGFPIFSKEATFVVFAVSNAISLFSSTASLLMFLSILTARYAEGDFARSLPSRLIIGLIMLFLSITSMMIAFSSTLYVIIGDKSAWILIPVVAAACFPVTLFASLQFPLLLDMMWSTYGPGIFGPNKG